MQLPIDNVHKPLQFRVPFLRQETGLGDAVARVTQGIGVKPCESCKKRQELLNRAVQFNPWST